MSAREEIVGIIVEHLGVERERILDEVTFTRLDADSLDMVELVMSFEETFGISIDDEEAMQSIAETNTVADAVNFLDAKIAAKAALERPAPVLDERPTRDSFPRTNRVEGRNFID